MLDKVKSKYILNAIFENIRNKKKLNIIRYNKRIKERLDIKKRDYKEYELLKEFNKKYYLNIEDIDIKELNLNKCHIRNEGLKYLNKINFNQLNILDLSDNDISDISILEKVNFKELKELNLSWNDISDISILEKINFKELNKLG